MAEVYTEEILQPLNKTQLIILFSRLRHRKVTQYTLTKGIKEIHCCFKKHESEIIAVKKVNDALVKELSSLERQFWKNEQYFNRECVEVVGTPSSVEHNQLEPTVWRILHHIGVNISGSKIEACHQLSKNINRIIVKFSSIKDCECTMPLKTDL